jgi:hypothetical protein
MVISKKEFPLNLATFDQLFHRNPFYESKWIWFFWLPNGKNLPQKKKKKNTNGKQIFFGVTQLSIIQEFYDLLVYVASMC